MSSPLPRRKKQRRNTSGICEECCEVTSFSAVSALPKITSLSQRWPYLSDWWTQRYKGPVLLLQTGQLLRLSHLCSCTAEASVETTLQLIFSLCCPASFLFLLQLSLPRHSLHTPSQSQIPREPKLWHHLSIPSFSPLQEKNWSVWEKKLKMLSTTRSSPCVFLTYHLKKGCDLIYCWTMLSQEGLFLGRQS